MTFYEHETWISGVTSRKGIIANNKIFRDYRYHYIYNVSEKLLQEDRTDKIFIKNDLSFKKTPLLYEYYIVVLLIDILKEIGFEWIEGWIADFEQDNICFGDLSAGTKMIFGNHKYKIEVKYDDEVKREITKENDFICGAAINRRPDILIAIYQKSGKILNAMVIEVKCRKTRYIYNEKEDTEVIQQLKNYYSLAYYDKSKKRNNLNRSIISKILVTYPRQSREVDFDNSIFNFQFIQVSPSVKNEIPYGYEQMKMSIEDFLKESEENAGEIE